ncbi:MAG: cell division protein FtsL [Eubacteriales bacterium]
MHTAEQRYLENENEAGFIRQNRRNKAQKALSQEKPKSAFTQKDRAKLIMLLLVIGILCVAGVVSTAYATQIKYNLNEISKQNQIIQGEIDNINVIIEGENNITKIEDKALNQLGMVYPSYDQIVYISQNNEKINNFASVLREQAYN